MTTYVLVHGAWAGSWGWTGTARSLRAAGHEVWTPSLTGLGERAHLASPAIGLGLHVQDVVAQIECEDLRDIILCGHSYGGMVITGVAARVAERIHALVYLDAFLPNDGRSLWDVADDLSRRHFIDGQRETPGMVAPFPQPPGAPRRLSHQPLLTIVEPVQAGPPIARRSYIYATRGAPTVFTQFYESVRDDPAWTVHAIDSGHVVMADDPEGLVRLLLAEA